VRKKVVRVTNKASTLKIVRLRLETPSFRSSRSGGSLMCVDPTQKCMLDSRKVF
jgi:hypothetical protein